MDTTLLAAGFPQQENADDGEPQASRGGGTENSVAGSSGAMTADANAAATAAQNQLFLQQQQFQQQMSSMLPSSLMGASPQFQQQLSALSGLTSGSAGATNNLFNMGAGQGYLMQPQQQLFQGGFPQGFNPQLFGASGLNPQQQQQNLSDLGQALDQGNIQQMGQVPNHQLSQLPQGMNQLQQLQQLMMTQQLLAQSGGMMPGNLSALFPMNNPMSNMGQPSLMGGWPGLGQQMQQQGMPNQGVGAAANAMNLFLSGLSGGIGGGNPASSPSVVPPSAAAAAATEGKLTAESEWAEPFFGKGKKEPPFPLKLHQILGNPEFAECISWNAHGRSWRILKPPVFEQVVIPLYFRHAKYASFMRQVNGWGFKRIVSGNDHNSYYHEYFVQENPQLCLKMMRIKKKTESSKAKKGGGDSDDDDESKAGTEDDASLARPPAQTGSAASSSVPAQITASQMPMFQSQDILIGGQQQNQSPGLLAALQNMQQGAAGVSAFQSPAFPGNNPTNHLAGLASSMGMPGLQNADAQWILTAGLLGGGSAGNIGGPNNNMVAPGLNALAGLGQAPNAVLGGGIQQQDLRQAGQLASGSAPGPLGDLTGIDPALLAKLQEAIQQQQQQQQQSQAPLPPASSHPVDNSLSAGADLGQQLPVGDQLVAGQDVVAPQLQQAAAATLSATDANAGDDEDGDEYGDDDGGSDDSGSDYASSGSEKD